MKFISKFSILALLLATFSFTAFAAQTQKKSVTLDQKVEVAGKQLKPGDYTLQWEDGKDNTNVTFYKNGKAVLTAPAKILNNQKNQFNASMEFHNENGQTELQRVYVKDQVLEFGNNGANQSGSGQSGSAQ